MAISYPRDLPIIPFKSSRIGLNKNQAVFESDMSRQITIQNYGAGKTDRWEGMLTTAQLTKNEMADYSAWIVSLEGRKNTFYAYDPDRKLPRGLASSSTSIPLVNEIGAVGRSLITDGWAANMTGLLEAGDYIQVGTGFHMITEAVDSDPFGNAMLNFEPVLRVSPTDNDPIIFENPKLKARLTAAIEGIETDHLLTGIISLSWEEAL